MKADKDRMQPQKTAKSGKDLLGPNTEIGRKLRQYYDEISTETVPDRFTSLLSELERAESTQKKG